MYIWSADTAISSEFTLNLHLQDMLISNYVCLYDKSGI